MLTMVRSEFVFLRTEENSFAHNKQIQHIIMRLG